MTLHIFLLLLYFCFRCCAISLDQPSVLTAMVGSTVNLNCSLQVGDKNVTRVNLYWYSLGINSTLKTYWYPHNTMTGGTINTSVRLSNPNNSADMSLSVSNLSLAYTDTYVCFVSLVGDFSQSSLSGKGTFLLVHEPLDTSVNETNIICRTKVRTVANLTLLWKLEDGTLMNGDYDWLANSNNSYWIRNVIPNGTFLCPTLENATFTCLLQYKGTTVVEERVEITCTGDPNGIINTGSGEARQPVLLYSGILGSSLLILIVILMIWFRMKWIYRTNVDSSPYTNISDLKRVPCL